MPDSCCGGRVLSNEVRHVGFWVRFENGPTLAPNFHLVAKKFQKLFFDGEPSEHKMLFGQNY